MGRKLVLANARVIKKKTNKDGSVSLKPDIFYKCNVCKDLHKLPEVQVDHINPIRTTPEFPPDGVLTWDDWIKKVFCGIENLQVICKPCHKIKTKEEKKHVL